jgi:hypothetical protein
MLTKEHWQQALDVQNACNLSGVLHSFNAVIDDVWAEAHEVGKGTDYVNTHPLVRLWVDKLAHLSGIQGMQGYSPAGEAASQAMHAAYQEAYRQTQD